MQYTKDVEKRKSFHRKPGKIRKEWKCCKKNARTWWPGFVCWTNAPKMAEAAGLGRIKPDGKLSQLVELRCDNCCLGYWRCIAHTQHQHSDYHQCRHLYHWSSNDPVNSIQCFALSNSKKSEDLAWCCLWRAQIQARFPKGTWHCFESMIPTSKIRPSIAPWALRPQRKKHRKNQNAHWVLQRAMGMPINVSYWTDACLLHRKQKISASYWGTKSTATEDIYVLLPNFACRKFHSKTSG